MNVSEANKWPVTMSLHLKNQGVINVHRDFSIHISACAFHVKQSGLKLCGFNSKWHLHHGRCES
jgi:hypothetical protein